MKCVTLCRFCLDMRYEVAPEALHSLFATNPSHPEQATCDDCNCIENNCIQYYHHEPLLVCILHLLGDQEIPK